MPESEGHYKVVCLCPATLAISSSRYIEEELNQMRKKGWRFVSIALEYNGAMRSGGAEGMRTFIAVFEKMDP